MTMAKKAAMLLAGLGNTPDEIYQTLLGSGYKGVKLDGYECPCGACLRDHLGRHFHVGYAQVREELRHPGYSSTLSTAKLPNHVTEFIDRYDRGHYRSLVRKIDD